MVLLCLFVLVSAGVAVFGGSECFRCGEGLDEDEFTFTP
jgi:hypothetical protein